MKYTIRLLTLGFALAVTCNAAQAATAVYRWVDKDGIVHYGDRAPEGVAATLVSVDPNAVPVPEPPPVQEASAETPAEASNGSGEQVSYAEQRRRERAERREEFREAEQERQAVCSTARERVAYLEPTPRVLVQDEDGNTRRLDDDERLRLLEEAKAYIAENCGPG